MPAPTLETALAEMTAARAVNSYEPAVIARRDAAQAAALPLLIAHISACSGKSDEACELAARSFLLFGNAPQWGLGDPAPGMHALYSDAYWALVATAEAGAAVLAHRVAA